MEFTTKDLLDEFNAYTAYTQSDEITLVIPSLMTSENHKGTNKPQWKHAYSGRVQKMSSLIAGFTTMRFNLHLNELINEYYKEISGQEFNEKYLNTLKTKVGSAWFDCRVYGVDNDEEAFNSVMWRVRDAVKNSRSIWSQHTLAQYYFEQSNSEQYQPS